LTEAYTTAIDKIGIFEDQQTDTAVKLELFGRLFYKGTVTASLKFTFLVYNFGRSLQLTAFKFSSIISINRMSA
jgi:hypothetical protein